MPRSRMPRRLRLPSSPRGAIALALLFATLLVAAPARAVAAENPAWVARHGLSSADYQSEFNRWVGAGYRLVSVSGYDDAGAERYAAIWRKVSGPSWQARHGMTSQQYQATFNQLVAQGYRPVLVNGYEVGGTARFAAIFELGGSAAWVARHDLTSAQYQAEFDTRVAQGYRLLHVSGYTSGGAERYAAVWERSPGPAARAFHGLTSSQYQSLFNQMTSQGYRPTLVSAYRVGGTDKYAGILEKSSSYPWYARHDLDATRYQHEVTDLRLQGYSPVQVSVAGGPGGPRFAALWENRAFSGGDLQTIDAAAQRQLSASNATGLSLAIAHRGRLVFAKGYGLADKASGTPMRPSHRMRMASVSKPITAIEIMRLVERGQLRLDDRVFGRGALLGERYGAEAAYADPRVRDITVRHLLEHTAGGWDNDGSDGSGDPMFFSPSLSQAALIEAVLKSAPLEYAPGTRHQYSNFGYSVLGRVIERVTGKPYETAMRDGVLAPSGAASFAVGGDTLSDKLPDEVTYHQAGNGWTSPYGMPVRRMDAHGGWIATPIDVLRVAVRADGFPTVPDLLNPSSMATMTTRTTAPDTNGNAVNYAKGWAVNNAPNWWHNGYLPGTQSMLIRTAGEFTVYAATNSTNADGTPDANLDALLWDVMNGVRSWPSHNLF